MQIEGGEVYFGSWCLEDSVHVSLALAQKQYRGRAWRRIAAYLTAARQQSEKAEGGGEIKPPMAHKRQCLSL